MKVPMRAMLPWSLFLSASLSSCGSGDDTQKFLGTWTYLAGSKVDITCPGRPLMSVPLSGSTISITAAPGNRIAVAASSGGCTYSYTVSGDVATAVPGQSCSSIPDGMGGHLTEVPGSGPALTTHDGKMMTDTSTGTLNGTCMETTSATLSHS